MNLKTKMNGLVGSIAFLVIGIAVIILSMTVLKENTEGYMTVKATIYKIEEIIDFTSDTDSTHDVIVNYEIDGQKYRQSLGYFKDGMKEGQTVEIKVNPSDYSKIVSSDYSEKPFMYAGLAAAAIGIIGIVVTLIKRNNAVPKQ